MGTSSTKSNSTKKRRRSGSGGATKNVVRNAPTPPVGTGISDRTWWILVGLILSLAAFFRLYDLNLVPLHHDEGVNGNFLVTLVRQGHYHYNPANYHGPTLYYITAAIPWTLKLLFGVNARETYGLNTIVIRLVPALFGLATVGLFFSLRRRLGTIATLAAAFLLAISPGAVYLSRYFIHETLFVFFTLGTVVAGLRFYEKRNPTYLILASVSAALLFATKETAIISAAVLIIAFISTRIYLKLVDGARGRLSEPRKRKASFVKALGGPATLALWLVASLLVFIVINVFLYSSFFQNFPQGVYDSLKTFAFWTKTGKAAHVHPANMYLYWLTLQESALLGLAVVGTMFVLFRPSNSFAMFSSLWSFGLIAAYSLVPYKTPWLVLNFIIPLALIAGYCIQRIYDLEGGRLRFPLAILLIAGLIGLYQSIDLNFFNYDNDKTYYVYVYAHTKRGTKELVEDIDRIAKTGDQGGKTGITIVSPDYWPLPWYLRNYSRVGYYGHMTSSSEPIIIASETQQAEVEATFGAEYEQVRSNEPGGAFSLRPGVDLLLYVRRGFGR